MNPAKLHPSLNMSVTAKSADPQPIGIIVRVRKGPKERGEMRAMSGMSAEREFKLFEAQAMTVSAGEIAELTDDPSVDLIWPDLSGAHLARRTSTAHRRATRLGVRIQGRGRQSCDPGYRAGW